MKVKGKKIQFFCFYHFVPGIKQMAGGVRQTGYETFGALLHHQAIKAMSYSKDCLLLAFENIVNNI